MKPQPFFAPKFDNLDRNRNNIILLTISISKKLPRKENDQNSECVITSKPLEVATVKVGAETSHKVCLIGKV